jgi:hypothetical protein
LEIHRADLGDWLEIKGDMQDDIAFFECLAQVTLLALRARRPGMGGGVLAAGCDNQTSVGALRKGMSTKFPLAAAVQAMAYWERKCDVKARVTYLPGDDNEAADQLSRWRQKGLGGFDPGRECPVALSDVLGSCPIVPM